MTTRRAAAGQVLVGMLLWALGARALSHVVAPADGASPAVPDAPERAARAPAVMTQTLRDGEPPKVVGASFDDDAALPARSKAVASYTLSARLDAERHTIDGRGTLVWENASTRPAGELYFHLYLNAFKNNQTVFLRSPFGAGRSGHGARKWGYVDVKRLAVREMAGVDVWPRGASGAADDSDEDDETDIRVPLPRPVAPGERITVDLEWTSQLPEIVERTGYVRDFHMVGQWFPKIARREPDGVWVHFPFHAQSEFYADFGSYDVSLDVPADMVVGATGVRVGETVDGGRRRARYRIDDVHDFAWTAWRGFLERTETMDGVSVRLLYPPGNDGNAAATLRAVRHGLRSYGAAYGKYPYPALTVVHPPAFAPSATGMEYPTLITTGFPWYTYLVSSFVERVTLHELGHEWFYGLVATDEHAFPFLDEGLTTYAETRVMRELLGPASGFRAPGLSVSDLAYLRGISADAGHDDVVARPAADFPSFRQIGALVYARTGIILETLGRVFGEAPLARALGRYARRYRFDHPGPKHLVAVVREVMGDEPADFLAAALFEGATVDFVVKDLQSVPARPAAGVFDRAEGRETKDAPEPSGSGQRFASRALVYRHGALRVPVDVELRFADGSRQRKHWDGRGRFAAIDATSTSRMVAAIVDPDDAVLLDDDLTNNRALTSGSGTAARVVERGLYAAELALGVLGP
jgi:hypothetical protein